MMMMMMAGLFGMDARTRHPADRMHDFVKGEWL